MRRRTDNGANSACVLTPPANPPPPDHTTQYQPYIDPYFVILPSPNCYRPAKPECQLCTLAMSMACSRGQLNRGVNDAQTTVFTHLQNNDYISMTTPLKARRAASCNLPLQFGPSPRSSNHPIICPRPSFLSSPLSLSQTIN